MHCGKMFLSRAIKMNGKIGDGALNGKSIVFTSLSTSQWASTTVFYLLSSLCRLFSCKSSTSMVIATLLKQ